MFEDSILIVAHPDDDILWFGSVFDKVENVIFCFNDDPHNPELGVARKKTIEEYLLPNVSTLDIIEPRSWGQANWSRPVVTEFGIKLERCRESDVRYQETFQKLLDALKDVVVNRKNVFTHNPWGEYGHEEHVLVYRALKTLQSKFQYDLWFSNYCSNRSVNLMNHYISGFSVNYECLPVNLERVREIAQIYKKNDCWTWYEDYRWFESECIMKEKPSAEQSEMLPYGRNFPVNYIKIHTELQKLKPHRLVEMASILKSKLKYHVNSEK